MTNLFILCFQFPPKPNTASQRPYAWAKYFSDFGYYPIVITKDYSGQALGEVRHEKEEGYEVYRISMKEILQGQAFKMGKEGKVFRRRFLSFLDKIFPTSLHFGPYKKALEVAQEVISKTPGKKVLLTTAMPFGAFRVAYLLNKNTGINWIGDYRDDWTTTELPKSSAIKRFLSPRVERTNEIKWMSTASGFTSVSEHYVNKIGNLLGGKIPGACIENGFFAEEHVDFSTGEKNNHLSFVYVGSMYPTQDISPIISGLKMASVDAAYESTIEVVFLGTNFSATQKKKIEDLAGNSVIKLRFVARVPKEEALRIQRECHIALIVPHTNLKGIPSSKIYEFVGAKMPVLAYPSDRDIIQDTLQRTGLGILPVDDSELKTKLVELLQHFKEEQDINVQPDDEAIAFYSRRASTQRLAVFLDSLSYKLN